MFPLIDPIVKTREVKTHEIKAYANARKTIKQYNDEEYSKEIDDALSMIDSHVDDLNDMINDMNSEIEAQCNEIEILHRLIDELVSDVEHTTLWVPKYNESMSHWLCDHGADFIIYPYHKGALIVFKDDGTAKVIFTLHFLRGN